MNNDWRGFFLAANLIDQFTIYYALKTIFG